MDKLLFEINETACCLCGKPTKYILAPVDAPLCDECIKRFEKYYERKVKSFIEEFKPVVGMEVEDTEAYIIKLKRFKPFVQFLRAYKGRKIIGVVTKGWNFTISLILEWITIKIKVPAKAIFNDLLLGEE